MNRTGTTSRTESRGYSTSRVPRDHYQDVTDRIIAALEAGTPPWRRPWDPDKAGGPAMPRNAATGQRYRGINVLTLGMSALAFSSGDPRWATYKQAEDRGWQVRMGERGTTGFFFKKLELRDDSKPDDSEDSVRRIPLLRAMAARPSKPRRISVTPAAIQMRTPGPGVIIPAAPRSHGATLAGSRPHQRGHVHRQQVRSRSIPFRPCSEALLAAVGPARCAAGSPKRFEPEPTAPEPQRPAAPAANGRSDWHKSRCVARGPGCEFQVTTIAPPSPHETQQHALGDDR